MKLFLYRATQSWLAGRFLVWQESFFLGFGTMVVNVLDCFQLGPFTIVRGRHAARREVKRP